MSLACPRRQLSHSEWRLKIYKQLFAPPAHRACRKRRFFSQSRCQSSSKSSENRAPASDHNNGDKIWRPPLWKNESDDTARPKQRPPAKKWNPYSDEGRNDLKSLVNSFHGLGDSLGGLDGNDTSKKPFEGSKLVELPQSPILKKQLGRRQERKREPTQDERALENDPWAAMLASPVRMCNVTKVRLPIPLLTNWGLLKHPETGQVFIMPDQLADVEQLEHMGARQLEQRSMARARHTSQLDVGEQRGDDLEAEEKQVPVMEQDTIQKASADPASAPTAMSDTPMTPIRSTPLYPKNAPAIRVLPSKQVMDFLKDEFTFTERPHDPTSPRKTKAGAAVAKILPQDWRKRIDRAKHYESNRREVERATGLKDFRPEPVELAIRPENLKWQPDIGERLLDILRRRVVACLERVLTVTSSGLDDTKRSPIKIKPNLLEVFKNCGSWEGMARNSTETRDLDAVEVVTNASRNATDGVSTVHDSEASSGSGRTTPPHAAPYASPRVLLYLSANPDSAKLGKLPTPPIPGTTPSTVQDELDVLPQKIAPTLPPFMAASPEAAGDRHYTPVFPMRAMLGAQRYKELLDIFSRYKSLLSSGEALMSSDDEEQVVSVGAKANFGDILFAEIWRLWRYVGGRKCMWDGKVGEVDPFGGVRKISNLDSGRPKQLQVPLEQVLRGRPLSNVRRNGTR